MLRKQSLWTNVWYHYYVFHEGLSKMHHRTPDEEACEGWVPAEAPSAQSTLSGPS